MGAKIIHANKKHAREFISGAWHELLALCFEDYRMCICCGEEHDCYDYRLCKSCIDGFKRSGQNICMRCGEPLTGGGCRMCAYDSLEYINIVRAPFLYEDNVRKLLLMLKENSISQLNKFFALEISAMLPNTAYSFIIPTPISARRMRQRGFNQALILARSLSRVTGIPVLHCMKRIADTPKSAGLSYEQRRENADASIGLRRNARLSGANLLIIDDIITTGSTAGRCARLLKSAGAERVDVVCAARTAYHLGDREE